MSLKDRLTNSKKTQQEKVQEKDFSEYNISLIKILDLIRTIDSPEKLGLIVTEIAKFLENFATEDMTLNISGDLDCGKQALLKCLLSGVIEEKTEYLQNEPIETQNDAIEELSSEIKEERMPEVEQQIFEQSEESSTTVNEEPQKEDPPMVKKRKTLRQKLKGM